MPIDKVHLRHCVLCEFQQGRNATEACKNLVSVFGKDVVSDRMCSRWFEKFEAGDFDLNDKTRSGRPSLIDDDIVRTIIQQNPFLTTSEITEKLKSTQRTISDHVRKLDLVYEFRNGQNFPSSSMQKEIARTNKVLHPNSRKIMAIAKRSKKILNKQKAKMAGTLKQSLIGEKLLWIQQNMVPDITPYTPELTAELLLKYIGRNDEELEQIAIKHSVGGKRSRQHASREDIIRMTKKREQEEFDTCGIEIPDILNPAQCKMLRTWNGELRLLPNFKFRRFGKMHLKEILQKAEKQSKMAVNKSTNCSKSAICLRSSKNSKDAGH